MPAGNPNLYFASRPEVGRQFHAASEAALCTRLIDNLRGRAYIFQVLYLFFLSISLFDILNSFYPHQPYLPGVHRAACVLLPLNLRKVLKTTRTRPPTSHPITTKFPPNVHPMPTVCTTDADRCPPLLTPGFQDGKGFLYTQGLAGSGAPGANADSTAAQAWIGEA
jgi:hypothetical protein